MDKNNKNYAKLLLPNNKTVDLPIIEGTVGPKVIDIFILV